MKTNSRIRDVVGGPRFVGWVRVAVALAEVGLVVRRWWLHREVEREIQQTLDERKEQKGPRRKATGPEEMWRVLGDMPAAAGVEVCCKHCEYKAEFSIKEIMEGGDDVIEKAMAGHHGDRHPECQVSR